MKLKYIIPIFLLLLLVACPAQAWYQSYDYRQLHNITGSSSWGGSLTNYEVMFVVNTSSGTSSGSTIYLNGHSESDLDDLRFTTTSDSLLEYWIESTSNPYNVWVKMPTVTTGTNQIYVYYGNSSASAYGNGWNVFNLWDHFDEAGGNGTTWTQSGGSASIASSIVNFTGTASAYEGFYSDISYGVNYSYRGRVQPVTHASGNAIIAFSDVLNAPPLEYSNGFYQYWSSPNWYNAHYTRNGANNENTGSLTTDRTTFDIYEEERNGTTSSIYLRNGVSETNSGTNINTQSIPLNFVTYYAGSYIKVDWIFVRDYRYPEPAHSDWGSEESFATPPVAAFSANITEGFYPLTVAFTDSSTNTPTSWYWDFGDGNTSTSQNPTYTYYNVSWIDPSTFTVRLNASNSAGYDWENKTDYIAGYVDRSTTGLLADPSFTPTDRTDLILFDKNESYVTVVENFNNKVYVGFGGVGLYDDVLYTDDLSTFTRVTTKTSHYPDETYERSGHVSSLLYNGSLLLGGGSWSGEDPWISRVDTDDTVTTLFEDTPHLADHGSISGIINISGTLHATKFGESLHMGTINSTDGGSTWQFNPTYNDTFPYTSGSTFLYHNDTSFVIQHGISGGVLTLYRHTIFSNNTIIFEGFNVTGITNATGFGDIGSRHVNFKNRDYVVQGWNADVNGKVYYTTDNKTFAYVTGPPYNSGDNRTSGLYSDGNYLYVCTQQDAVWGSVWRTFDGDIWERVLYTDQTDFVDVTTYDGYMIAGGRTTISGISVSELFAHNLKPIANFTANITEGFEPLIVQFTDTTNFTPLSTSQTWNWSFGDGTYSEDQNPIHTFTVGNYTVNLTATDLDGSDTKTGFWINVTYIPIVTDFSGTPLIGNPPFLVSFTDETSSGTPTAWNWSFGDGDYSELQNPGHAYNALGLFNVTLNASNAFTYDIEEKTFYINSTNATIPTPTPTPTTTSVSGVAVQPYVRANSASASGLTYPLIIAMFGGLAVVSMLGVFLIVAYRRRREDEW